MSIGVIAFDETQITSATNRAHPRAGDPAPTLAATSRSDVVGPLVRPRRLTPREWERLFGFADDYTAIPVGKRGKPAKDAPRYRVLGNSMAVTVMAWVGRRLLIVDEIVRGRNVNRDTVDTADEEARRG
jgi:DNA (cytosine-5)-methyltransferase 1